MKKITPTAPVIRFRGFTDVWEQRKLNNVADVRDGTHDSPRYRTEGHPFITSKNIKDGFINYADIQYISDEDFNEINKRSKVEVNDILMGMIGTIGNMALVREKPDYAIKNVALIKDTKKVHYLYLYHFLHSNNVVMQLFSGIDGGTQKFVSLNNIRNLNILFPNLKEQVKLGSFFEKIDYDITLYQRKLEQQKKLKKYFLQNMFPEEGETVPRIRFKEFAGDWEQRKIADVAEIITGGTPSTRIVEYWNPPEVPWLSSGEVHKKYITSTDTMISRKGYENSSATMVRENSVLIALAGQGKTRGTVAINRIPLATNQSIAAMTFSDDIDPDYVFSNLENRYEELRRISSGDGSRGGLNKKLVGDVTIPCPTLLEQNAIGTLFRVLNELITLHQRKLDQLQNVKKFMLQNLFV